MANNEDFARIMETAKFVLRINQKELAKLLGCSESFLSEIKKGNKKASGELFEKLSALIPESEKITERTPTSKNSTKDRLLEFLRYKGMGQQKFENSIGMSNGWVNKVGNSIREISLRKIKEVYPELNIAWLISGAGNMLTGDSEGTLETPGDNETSEEITAKLVPLLPIAAQGGSLNDFVVSVKESDCENVVSPIRGADFAMPISGDSMAPEYPNGSQIFIKRINENAFIEWGKVYVLDTCNGVVVKILVPSQKEGYVRCVSINTDPIFAPFEIAWEDINGVYRVLLCMSVK